MGREFQPIRIQDEKILTNKKQRSGNDLIAGKCVWINLTFAETSSIKKKSIKLLRRGKVLAASERRVYHLLLLFIYFW